MLRGSRRYRLTGTGAFEVLLRSGRRREGQFLQLIDVPAARELGRTGIVIGRKALPLAVDRNRVRRLLRVRLHEARPAIERYDLVLRLKKRAARTEFALIAAEAARLLSALAANRESP